VVTIHRNHRIARTSRPISYVLKKQRFLGPEYEYLQAEVGRTMHLRCDRCRRRFETKPEVLETFRCMECDRRLSVSRRTSVGSAGRRSPSTLQVARYDRLMPGTLLGGYKINELLGVGGYGAVYKALDTRMQRTVALKVFPAGREGSADVLREARNVASFPPHPNLVLVYHVGEADGFDFISYEYVSGSSLAYHIERRTKTPLNAAMRLMRDVAEGLRVAHHFGVIHRDVKPDNILLVRVEGRFRARLTDFGLGQRLRRGQGGYHSKTIRGAPEYLAPEQFSLQISSVASDLYGMGATFYHLITGRPPFEGQSDHEVAVRHVDDPVPSLLDKVPSCTRALDQLFRRMLAKSPKDRPQAAEDVLDLLTRAENELQRRQAWASRRMSVALGMLATLALLAGIYVFSGGARRVASWFRSDASENAQVAARTAETSAGEPHSPRPASLQTLTSELPVPLEETLEAERPVQDSAQLGKPAALAEPGLKSAADPAVAVDPPPAGARPVEKPEQAVKILPPSEPSEVVTAVHHTLPAQEQHEWTPPPPIPLIQELPYLQTALQPLIEWVKLQAPGVSGLSAKPEVELARQRLLLLGDLFERTIFLGGEEHPQFLQKSARTTLGDEGLLVSLPIYSAQQVGSCLDHYRSRLDAVGLANGLRVRLPHRLELAKPGLQAPETGDLARRLEWIDHNGELVLFDYDGAAVRPESGAANYRRRSSLRLHLTLDDPELLLQLIQEAVESLAGP
jgi:serine/threonine protein kinase